jgi:hypothetical protein
MNEVLTVSDFLETPLESPEVIQPRLSGSEAKVTTAEKPRSLMNKKPLIEANSSSKEKKSGKRKKESARWNPPRMGRTAQRGQRNPRKEARKGVQKERREAG